MAIKLAVVLFTCAAALAGCGDDQDTIGTAEVQLNPGQFLFAKLALGSDADRQVQLQNIGSGELIIASIDFDLDNAEQEFELYWKRQLDDPDLVGVTRTGDVQFGFPLRVPAGESLYLILNYRAVREVPVGGRIVFETNAPDTPLVEIPVDLQEGAPEINVNPLQYDFERVAAGDSDETSIQVANIGQLDLEIRDVLLNGDQDFKPLIEVDGELRDPRQIPDGELVRLLTPGETFDITVRYSPLVEGPGRAELVIFSNDPNRGEVAVSLAANGATPCLQANPPALEFRTSLVNRTDSRPMALESCGGAPIEITRIYLQDADPAFQLVEDSLPALPAIMPAYAQEDRDVNLPPPSRSIEIAFTPREERIHNGTLVIESNDPVTPRREVPLLGRGVTNACPQARAVNDEFYVVPLDVVVFDGSPSIDQDGIDARPVAYEWVITSRPAGSVSQPHESFYDPAQPANGGLDDDIETPTAVFFVDLAGTYTAELRVRDNLGLDSIACENPAVVTIVAEPEEAIHVQLVWRTPEDDDETDQRGTDLDLHLLHPAADSWFSRPFDCHYNNPVPDWGQLGNPADDPSLDIDDINGAGPENINLDNPENTETLGSPYLVGVHYYNSRDRVDGTEYGPSFATVRIFIEGQLSWDFTDNGNPGEKEMQAQDHFWDVAQISWPSGDVVTRDRYYMARP